jgi:replicative DNA helicase
VREASAFTAVGEARAGFMRQAAGQAAPPERAPRDSRVMYEREVLRKLFEHPNALSSAGEILATDSFSTPGLQALYREMLNAWDEHAELVPGALLAHLPPEAKPELEAVLEHVRLPENQAANPDEEARLVHELRKLAEHAQIQAAGAHSLNDLRVMKARKGPGRA